MKSTKKEAPAEAKIPVTTRQAFKILDEQMTEEDIRAALSQTKDDFAIDQHFGLGMWIRNNWIYGDEDEEECVTKRRQACAAMLTGQREGEFVLCDPDMMSEELLRKYYDHLRRKNILL